MATGPKLTGPVERLGAFRHFLNTDTCSHWNAATEPAMVALQYTAAGDRVYVGADLQEWLVLPAASLTPSTDVLNGTGASVQYLRYGIQVATSSNNGLMPASAVTTLSGLRNSRFKVTSNPAMQSISTAQVGDDCCVSTSDGDAIWLAVTKGKYSYGQNCLAGIVIDWLYQLDRIVGTIGLVAGHAFVYIPGLPSGSIASATYVSIVGEPGTLMASVTTNGINIDSWQNNEFDGSFVRYEVTLQ